MTAAARATRVDRWSASGGWSRRADGLAIEEPLEIRVNTRAVAVVMRTPGHDAELAAGFLLSEGVIRRRAEIASVRPYPRNREGNVVDVFTAPDVEVDLGQLTRHVFASSSCGICGRTTLAAVARRFPKVRSSVRYEAALLLDLPRRMREGQAGFALSGGLHAAAAFTADGTLLCLREDVGRHNAVDKVLGWLLDRERLPGSDLVLVVSGRSSFEIQQKARAGGLGAVVAVGAPSDLAVAMARRSGQVLVGFLRDDRFNVYAGRTRVVGRRGMTAGRS